MELYSPREIVAKIEGAHIRQVADLVEKGVVTPTRDTTARGIPRLFNKEGIKDLMIGLCCRGKLHPNWVKTVMSYIHSDSIKGPIKTLKISKVKTCDKTSPYHNDDTHTDSYLFQATYTDGNLEAPGYFTAKNEEGFSPAHFVSIEIDLKGINEFIDKNFE